MNTLSTKRFFSRIVIRLLVTFIGLIACSWLLHTISRVWIFGILQTSFMKHKVSEGFQPWYGWQSFLIVHATSAACAILFALLAFLLFYSKNWRWHKRCGKLYVVTVLISALTGLPLSITATGGLLSTVGFILLNTCWLATTIQVFLAAKRRQIATHKRWAIRSFSVTMANTTLTILTSVLSAFVHDHATAYNIAIWACLPLNLILAECWIVVFRIRNHG